MKSFKWIVTILCALFIAIQFIRPSIAPAKSGGEIEAPDSIKHLLQRACYDCHSAGTNLRWYDQIEPVYWQVAKDVNQGRKVLNFSDWKSLVPPDQKAKLWESVNQVILGAMPVNGYAVVHPSAKLSPSEISVLKNYLLSMVHDKPADTAITNAANKQYQQSTKLGFGPHGTPVAPNGVPYDADYKNWLPATTSERFDNGTMRVIMGNAIAIKAIRENNTNPWPNGTKFAKVAWVKVRDKAGNVTTGEFKQVEFMVKDDQKYASTNGWGFARFKTPAMKPYGKSAMFVNECINCHRPMNKHDFVFTIPVSASAGMVEGMKVYNSSIDAKNKTMSTMYYDGKAGSNQALLLTWKQRDDPHWFGARIPEALVSTKKITIAASDTSQKRSVMP